MAKYSVGICININFFCFAFCNNRKSKWDQPAPSAAAIQPATNVIKSAGLITTSITGTRTTVINAFGSLPKKSKQ